MNAAQYIPPNSDLDNYTTEGTFFCPSRGTEITHIPPQANSAEINGFSLCVLTTGAYGNGLIQYLTTYRSNQIYTRSYATVWQPWKQVAISEAPQEFKLETAAGYKTYHGYKNQYSMNSFGEVTVIGCIRRDDESVFPEMSAEDNTIAVLPQGYRPNEWLSVGGVLRFPSVEPKPCLVFIKNTGEISALIGAGMANQYKVIEFHVTYVATIATK